jgi:uncharacterized membrane protein
MVCMVHCAVSVIFLFGMLYLSFAVDKTSLATKLTSQLNADQQEKYNQIIQRRRSIYLTGFGIGTVLAIVAVVYSKASKGTKLAWTDLCLAGSIIFLTTYFYYILSPKPELMVVYLDTEEQRQAWSEIYKVMAFQYHLGLFLGVLAVVIFMKGLNSS